VEQSVAHRCEGSYFFGWAILFKYPSWISRPSWRRLVIILDLPSHRATRSVWSGASMVALQSKSSDQRFIILLAMIRSIPKRIHPFLDRHCMAIGILSFLVLLFYLCSAFPFTFSISLNACINTIRGLCRSDPSHSGNKGDCLPNILLRLFAHDPLSMEMLLRINQ